MMATRTFSFALILVAFGMMIVVDGSYQLVFDPGNLNLLIRSGNQLFFVKKYKIFPIFTLIIFITHLGYGKFFLERRKIPDQRQLDEIPVVVKEARDLYDVPSFHIRRNTESGKEYLLRGKKAAEVFHVERRSPTAEGVSDYFSRGIRGSNDDIVVEVRSSKRLTPMQRNYITDHLSSFAPSD